MPECLEAKEEFGDEVVVVSQELGWLVEEELKDRERKRQRGSLSKG